MPFKVLNNAYVIINRFILRAKIFLYNSHLTIRLLPRIAYVLTSVKGALSRKELELLIKSTLGAPEITIRRSDIQEINHVLLRKNRKDVAELFDVEKIKGNIYRVTIKYSESGFVRLILPQNELMKLKNYVLKTSR